MEYENKKRDYYAVIRQDLINLIDKDSKNLRVLEIGQLMVKPYFI